MNNKTTIRFWFRSEKSDMQGMTPVYLIYQISGERKYFPVPGVKMLSVNWDSVNKKAIYFDCKSAENIDSKINVDKLLTKAEVKDVNLKIQELTNLIAKIENKYKALNERFTGSMVIHELKKEYSPLAVKHEMISVKNKSLKIIKGLIELPMVVCNSVIYFLCLKKELIYIGEGHSGIRRIVEQKKEGRYFDNACVLQVPQENRKKIERACIKYYRPIENQNGFGRLNQKDKELLRNYLGLNV